MAMYWRCFLKKKKIKEFADKFFKHFDDPLCLKKKLTNK